jgi:hypothetical protein
MSNVLSREKREQVIALGRLGWSLRRIEQATGVRRETAGEYLRVAGIALRRPGGWGRHGPAKPAINLTTDSGSEDSKPAINPITDSLARKPGCGPASSCEAYGELIELELERGRNSMGIWQDLVDSHGFGVAMAISNHRLTAFDGEHVSFRWRDYAHGSKQRIMNLDAAEFLRRFFLHVLPKGFVRIRRYGLLSNRFRAQCLPLARRLLALQGRHPLPTTKPAADNAPLWHCPRCGGRMRVEHRFTATELAFIRELDSS